MLLSLKIGLQKLLGMSCLNIATPITLIGVSLINTLPFTITAFVAKKVKLRNVILSKPGITEGLLKSVRKKTIISLACEPLFSSYLVHKWGS